MPDKDIDPDATFADINMSLREAYILNQMINFLSKQPIVLHLLGIDNDYSAAVILGFINKLGRAFLPEEWITSNSMEDWKKE